MENNIYLYGASGHCKVIIDCIDCIGGWKIKGIFDDNPKAEKIFTIPVVRSHESQFLSEKKLIISIGNNRFRKDVSKRIKANYQTIIHPKAIVSEYSIIEEGTVIMASVVINPSVSIGKHCIINTGAIVEHDCIIDDFVHISPNVSLAGGIEVGEGTHIGIGASVIQGIKIGKWVTIGAGSVIIKEVPDYAIVVGNPGKIIKYN